MAYPRLELDGCITTVIGHGRRRFRTSVVAKRLGMSPRTLQRRLGERGTSYKDLLDTWRKTLAEERLKRNDLALCEIAYLLGFSDQSAFNRAFKRWTGAPPREFRRQAQGN